MPLIDIHTHRPYPAPGAVISCDAEDFDPKPGQLYSVGIHPWTLSDPHAALGRLGPAAAHPQAVALGECGLDTTKGPPMFLQMIAFRGCAELAERVGKPLVIHDVRAHDMLVGLIREFRPSVPWIIHGFRGKPTLAAMLLKAGFMLSFGPKFNPDTLRAVPAGKIFAETDDSDCTIYDVVRELSACRGTDMRRQLEENAARLFHPSDCAGNNVFPGPDDK